MTRTPLILSRTALALLVAMSVSAAQATIVVYDLEVDYSDTNNPSGTWDYFKGNTPLTHFSTVSDPNLALAVANGYWGDTNSSANSAFMKTTAFGSATGNWSNNDFWAGDLLVRTTDPNGPPMIFTWTAPSAGTFTYNGWIWYADAPSGPGGNSFTLSLNNGPTMEYGTAALGQDRTAATTMLNGLSPVNVLPGDVLSLQLDRLNIGPPVRFADRHQLYDRLRAGARARFVGALGDGHIGAVGVAKAVDARIQSLICPKLNSPESCSPWGNSLWPVRPPRSRAIHSRPPA